MEKKKSEEISKEMDIQTVAALSKLTLTEQEKVSLEMELCRMLKLCRELQITDTLGVPETAYVEPVVNVLREDENACSLSRAALLQNAPKQKDGCYFVPQVIRQEGTK